MSCVVGGMMVIFFVAGLALVWRGLLDLLQMIRRRPHLISVEGQVSRVERKVQNIGSPDTHRRRPGSNIAHYPVIHFLNQAGESVTFRSEVGDVGRESRYHTGQILKVLYDPEGVIPPMIDSWSGLWFVPISMTVAGLIFIGGSGLILVAFGDRILGALPMMVGG